MSVVMSLRMSEEEQRVMRAVAERLGRTEPDMLRTVVRAVARELDINPAVSEAQKSLPSR